VNDRIQSQAFINPSDYKRIKASLPNAPLEKSLKTKHPTIAKIWDKKKLKN